MLKNIKFLNFKEMYIYKKNEMIKKKKEKRKEVVEPLFHTIINIS